MQTIKNFILNNREYFEDFITRSTYHSNGIEGNTLSYAETYAILWNDNSFTVNAKPRELYEAINHKYALNYAIQNLDSPLSEKLIKDIAVQINKNIDEISGYRTVPVMIKGAEYIPPAPALVPQQMMYYVYNFNNTEYENPFMKIAEKHIEFERIHPFQDGNGRTGRVIMNFELLKQDIPPIVIPKEERTEYFKMISNQDTAALSEFFKKLSIDEYKRLKKFGYDKEKIQGVQLEHPKKSGGKIQ